MDSIREHPSFIARPNGRPPNQLLVKQDGRKPLFSTANPRGDENKPPGGERPQSSLAKFRTSTGSDGGLRRTLSESQGSSGMAKRDKSPGSVASPGGSRIPKLRGSAGLSGSGRKSLTLTEAWNMVPDDDEPTGSVDASPSPAPRLWRERRESEGKNMRTFIGREGLDNKFNERPFSRQSMMSLARPEAQHSPEKADEYRRRLYGKSRIGLGEDAARSPGRIPVRKVSSESVRSDAAENRPHTSLGWVKRLGSRESLNGSASLPALVPGIEDLPLPSIEDEGRQQQEPTPPSSRRHSAYIGNASPEKSFAWQIDQDFTAGDLQISESPRIRIDNRPFANRIKFDEDSEIDINSRTRVANPGSRNTKLDEIRNREVKAGSDLSVARQRNTKLEDIQAREAQVEAQIPIPDRSLPRPRNTKLDEIRQREIDGVPKRAFASSRLEEIREQNLMSRSRSPELRPRPSRESMSYIPVSTRELSRSRSPFRPKSAFDMRDSRETQDSVHETVSNSRASEEKQSTRPKSVYEIGSLRAAVESVPEPVSGFPVEPREPSTRPKSAFEMAEERIPDTSATTYKRREEASQRNAEPVEKEAEPQERKEVPAPEYERPAVSHSRGDSRDVLRRLARAASSSPLPETEGRKPPSPPPVEKPFTDSSDPRPTTSRRSLDNDRPSTRRESREIERRNSKETENSKPTVGFVGLRRSRSRDSVKSKRSSMQSEPDPTDRIEAEMKLFAPGENQSERGSVRAPSPGPEDEEETEDAEEKKAIEATPRPQKPDPLTMPTPKVTGAYVDTPATVKVEKREVKEEQPAREKSSGLIRDKKTGLAWRSRDKDTASDPGTDDQQPTITTSTGARRRRARSLPRRRGPLRNSAKLPSVKDDLMELQRTHHIDDSTLDDLEEVLSGRKPASPTMQALIKELPNKPSTSDFDFDETLDNFELDTRTKTKQAAVAIANSDTEQSDGDLARYDRMSKRLGRGLLGIRTVKQGIQRLSDQVSHVDTMATEKGDTPPTHAQSQESCATCTTPVTMSYVQLPFPRLYRRTPSFRLTFLGILIFVASLWYAAESTMCSMYCRPTSCASTPCVWSFDDPTFGTALPVKLDQWMTGGRGRVIFDNLLEEVDDWATDLKDLAQGRDIADVDMDTLSFEEKRKHRRRLQKKGLLKTRHDPPERRAKWNAWHETRLAKERAREAREMGYDVDDEEGAIGGDQPAW